MLGKVFLMLVLFGLYPIRAQAYIDPGTGGLILDALAAMVLGIGIFWRRVLAFCRKLMGKSSSVKDVAREKTEK
jgi:hypothetical protein